MRSRPTSERVNWRARSTRRDLFTMSDSERTITWRALWDETSAITGRPQARWLCEEASGAFGDEFADVLASPATERSVAHLDAMLARLLSLIHI